MRPDVLARAEPAAVTLEVLDDIAAEAEAVHDVLEFGRVREAQRMPALVQASEIYDGIAQQLVVRCGGRNIFSQLRHVGIHVNLRAALSIHKDGVRFAVKPQSARSPI